MFVTSIGSRRIVRSTRVLGLVGNRSDKKNIYRYSKINIEKCHKKNNILTEIRQVSKWMLDSESNISVEISKHRFIRRTIIYTCAGILLISRCFVHYIFFIFCIVCIVLFLLFTAKIVIFILDFILDL